MWPYGCYVRFLVYDPEECSMEHYDPRYCRLCYKLLDPPESIIDKLDSWYKDTRVYLPRRLSTELRCHIEECHVEPYASLTPCLATCINFDSGVMSPNEEIPQTTTLGPCKNCRDRSIIAQHMGEGWLEHEISNLRFERGEEDWELACCVEGTCGYE